MNVARLLLPLVIDDALVAEGLDVLAAFLERAARQYPHLPPRHGTAGRRDAGTPERRAAIRTRLASPVSSWACPHHGHRPSPTPGDGVTG
ncbi:MAG: hypothetical protein M0Z93_03875 [Actinomycetota bacterium]|nr:hypothetical protein [Actinomycetota bacterium]